MRVAVLGTGIMGAPMARNLAAAGHAVRAWNRSPEKAQGLDGVEPAATIADAVRDAEVVVTMLSDADAVEAVVEDALVDGAVLVQTSTIGPEATASVAERAAAAGVPFVDAPVLGTKGPAEQGKLIVLASGPEDVRERVEPVFEAIGSKTLWLGEAGAGSRLKLVVNTWLVSLTEGLAEAIALAEALDLDPQTFLDVIDGGPMGPPYASMKGKLMIERDFPPCVPARSRAQGRAARARRGGGEGAAARRAGGDRRADGARRRSGPRPGGHGCDDLRQPCLMR